MPEMKEPSSKRSAVLQNHPAQEPKITVERDGPYRVSGGIPLSEQEIVKDAEGFSETWRTGKTYPPQDDYALCRCGHARTAPFCDGSHSCRTNLTETAPYHPCPDQVRRYDGPFLSLSDCTPLCASAKFCDRAGGIWSLTTSPDSAEAEGIAITEAGNCPSGRLVIRNAARSAPIEPHLEPSLGLVEYPDGAGHGPVWVRGGVLIESADSKPYPVRNRVTLCRCGRSANKPFCDGSHRELLRK